MGNLDQLEIQNILRFLDHANDMIMVLDSSTSKVIYYNETVIEVTGYEPDQLCEMSVYDIASSFKNVGDWRVHVDNLRIHEKMIREDRIQLANGTWMDIEISVSFIDEKSGYHMAVLKDITQRKIRDEQLKEFQKKILKQNRELEEYAERIGHIYRYIRNELRTPIDKLLQESNYLLDNYGLDKEQVLELEKDIFSQSVDLSEKVNNALNMSTMLNESLELKEDGINLKELGRMIESRFGVLADKMGINLTVDFSNIIVKGDFGRVDQVLSNLILNYLKHLSRNGKILLISETRESSCYIKLKEQGSTDLNLSTNYNELYESIHTLNDEVFVSELSFPLCQEIMKALNSEIRVENSKNEAGYEFSLPLC